MNIPLFFRSPLIAAICLILVASIRFNRNDLIIHRPLNDAAFYISNVEKMRGLENTTYEYKGPFNERILNTTLAAFLPFAPLTAINIINLLFLFLGLYYLYKLLSICGLSNNTIWLGVYIFIFSFPTFYYSTIGYIDPSVLGSIFCGAYALYANRYGLFIIAIIAGALSKENIVILIPVSLAFAYSRQNLRWLLIGLISLGLIIFINFLLRLQFAHINNYLIFWEPKFYRIVHNLTRPNFAISTILSWGVPLFIGLYYFKKYFREIGKNWKEELPLWTAIASIIGTTVYMIIAAFPDGRNVWVAYCFPILLSLKWLDRFSNKSERVTNSIPSSEQDTQISQQ
jgi:hypothetical protein